MRIIAGSSGGIRLFVPKTEVRPTMDRVKAAIFSSLGERVPGANVLDLFAGTGALGIEALSRGAASATFVERNAQAVEAIERNLAQAHLSGRIRRQDVFDFLRQGGRTQRFDLIFADPPYETSETGKNFTELLLQNDYLPSCLTSKGLFILEKRPAECLASTHEWQLARRRTYGATETLFLQRKPAP
jgi:16S rRNA (guanine966-N2)-methyltransferase